MRRAWEWAAADWTAPAPTPVSDRCTTPPPWTPAVATPGLADAVTPLTMEVGSASVHPGGAIVRGAGASRSGWADAVISFTMALGTGSTHPGGAIVRGAGASRCSRASIDR